MQRLVLIPRGVFVTAMVTGELRDDDGSLIGVESRRTIVPADLDQDESGFLPIVRPFSLDLMGITVQVEGFAVDPALTFPRHAPATRRHLTALPPLPDQGPAS